MKIKTLFKEMKMETLRKISLTLGLIHAIFIIILNVVLRVVNFSSMKAIYIVCIMLPVALFLLIIMGLTVLTVQKLIRKGAGKPEWMSNASILAFLFPCIVGIVFYFLAPRPLLLIVLSEGTAQSAVCSNCGNSVPPTSAVGQRCSHCRAYWKSEEKGTMEQWQKIKKQWNELFRKSFPEG